MSTTSTSTSTSPTTSPAPSDGPPNPTPGLNPTSSLPFSFLITFLAIFLFFLGCGLGSRRVTRGLRRNLALEFAGWGSGRAATSAREKPRIWDAFPSKLPSVVGQKTSGGDVLTLSPIAPFMRTRTALVPLSATYIRDLPPSNAASALRPLHVTRAHHFEPDSTPTAFRLALDGMGLISSRRGIRSVPHFPPPAVSPASNTSLPPRSARAPRPEMRWRGHRLPDFIARCLLLDNEREYARVDPSVEHVAAPAERLPVRALQIAVLVAMPSPLQARVRREHEKAAETGEGLVEGYGSEGSFVGDEGMGDYVIGSMVVPWENEVGL